MENTDKHTGTHSNTCRPVDLLVGSGGLRERNEILPRSVHIALSICTIIDIHENIYRMRAGYILAN